MDRMCRRFEEDLVDLLDGTLDERAASALRGHMAGCPSCALAFQRMQEVRDALAPVAARRRAIVPDPGLADRIMDRIRSEAAPRRISPLPSRVPLFVVRRYAPMAAGFAILLAVGVMASMLGSATVPGLDFTSWTARTADHPTSKAAGQDSEMAGKDPTGQDMKDAISFLPEASQGGTVIATEPGVRNAIATSSDSTMSAVYDLLVSSGDFDGAAVFRALRMEDGSLRILLLLRSDRVQGRADRLSERLAPCASPFRIEIIDAKDIGTRLASLGLADADAIAARAEEEDLRMIALDIGR